MLKRRSQSPNQLLLLGILALPFMGCLSLPNDPEWAKSRVLEKETLRIETNGSRKVLERTSQTCADFFKVVKESHLRPWIAHLKPLTIYVFAKEKEFESFGAKNGIDSTDLGGFYINGTHVSWLIGTDFVMRGVIEDDRVFTYWHESPLITAPTIRHEVIHHLFKCFNIHHRRKPAAQYHWLNEGIAYYLSSPEIGLCDMSYEFEEKTFHSAEKRLLSLFLPIEKFTKDYCEGINTLCKIEKGIPAHGDTETTHKFCKKMRLTWGFALIRALFLDKRTNRRFCHYLLHKSSKDHSFMDFCLALVTPPKLIVELFEKSLAEVRATNLSFHLEGWPKDYEYEFPRPH